MKKMFNIIGLLLLIGFLIYFLMQYQDNKVKKEFDLFYSSTLSGKISKIDEYSRGSNFILVNIPTEFSFYPVFDKGLNDGEIFQYLAKPGDSIYKPAFSDTLLLIKADKVYSYTFQKQNNGNK